MLSNNKLLVYRFYGGIGVPYGNSSSLPFEKAFFAGGANDIRGWKMGSLGPGSYFNDTVSNTYNQIGDMQLQANFEYRFPVYKMIKGSVFLDAGNIWLLKPSQDFPGGEFNIDTFIPQIAIDAGFGIRLDFDFFVFRLDPAIPIRVPHYPAGDRWYFDKIQLGDVIWNFGIGYPF
jgi:outer membrane protein assembly factor BamA